MIIKDEKCKNKYILTEDTTTEDFKRICSGYKRLRCLICNAKTAKRFRVSMFGNSMPITVNNKVGDDIVYINGVF